MTAPVAPDSRTAGTPTVPTTKRDTMHWSDDGRLHFALGIEDTFVPQARPGERAIDEYELTDHYRRYASDLGLAVDVGAELLRWGVPWYRVSPEPGVWDWSWVDRVMARFRETGLTPVVDLLHYGTPLWLEGQFANPDYPTHVTEYAARFAARYGDVATDYTPVNEPVIHALFTGEYGYWPPYLTGAAGSARMATALATGFVSTQHAIARELGDAAHFVHVEAGIRYVGDVDAPSTGTPWRGCATRPSSSRTWSPAASTRTTRWPPGSSPTARRPHSSTGSASTPSAPT